MKLVVIVVATLLAVGLFFLATSDSGGATESLTSEVVAEVTETIMEPRDLAVPTEDIVVVPEDEKRTAIVDTAEVETGAVVAASAEASKPTLLQGRVVLTDDNGVEQRAMEGDIEFACWKGSSGSHVTVPVVGGAFEIDAEGLDGVSVIELSLGGRIATIDGSARLSVDQGPIVVHAHWPKELQLSVLDANTGAHLSQVRIVPSPSWEFDRMQHPGSPRGGLSALVEGNSPVVIVPSAEGSSQKDKVHFVHSPGYAWGSLRLDLSEGGEREIRLTPGGDLTIRILGDVLDDAVLRLRAANEPVSSMLIELPASADDVIEITSFAVGTYQATIEVGDWYRNPAALGEVEVVVVAGQNNDYELRVEPPAIVEEARLAGTLILPSEWALDSFKLKAVLEGGGPPGFQDGKTIASSDMQKPLGTGSRWGFDFGTIPIGRYELRLVTDGMPAGFEYAMLTELGAAGNEGVRFEIPPPGTVVIQIFEEPSGEPAEISDISWQTAGPGEHPVFAYMNIDSSEPGSGRFEFRAPVGKVSLHSFATGYETLKDDFEVHTGMNEFTYRLGRECPLMIVFLDGETPIPMAESHWYPRPEHLDGDGKLLYTSSGGHSGFQTALSKPGRYVFEMPEVEGYEAIPDQTITVQRGEETRHVVHLVRKR